MRRFATVLLALALCATFSFADYHHHVSDGAASDPCPACALASLVGCPPPEAAGVDASLVDQGLAAETRLPNVRPVVAGGTASRAPPASA